MIDFILDLIFPKRCVGCKRIGRYLCDNCFSKIELYQEYLCPMCNKGSTFGETHLSCIKSYSLDGLSCGVVYKGVVKRLLFRFKYSPFLSDLASTIGSIFVEALMQNELFMRTLSSHPIVVEVPLSSLKYKKRGYNQAEILGRFLAFQFQLKFEAKILKRTKFKDIEFSLNKEKYNESKMDISQIISKNKKILSKKTVLLVDDLVVSCATLRECAKVLKRNGAKKVFAVTFAREI